MPDGEKRMGLSSGTTDWSKIADADIGVEAVFEAMPIKKEVFAKIDKICKPGAVLASNTSTLDVDEIASATKRPESVIGMHFFSPANVMRLLEVVRGEKSAKDVVDTAMSVGRRIAKVPACVGVSYGFVGITRRKIGDGEILARLLYAMVNEGAKILEEKIAIRASDIDVIWVYGYGWPVYRGGPMFWADQVGLKTMRDRMQEWRKTQGEDWKPAPPLDRRPPPGKTFPRARGGAGPGRRGGEPGRPGPPPPAAARGPRAPARAWGSRRCPAARRTPTSAPTGRARPRSSCWWRCSRRNSGATASESTASPPAWCGPA